MVFPTRLVAAFSILTVLAQLSSYFKAVHSKILMYIDGLITMVATRDTKWKLPQNVAALNLQRRDAKRIIFIRHGESVWNEVFNRGLNIGLVGRLFKALKREISFLAKPYSVFLDTPLNSEGLQQALAIGERIEKARHVSSNDKELDYILAVLRGEAIVPQPPVGVSASATEAKSAEPTHAGNQVQPATNHSIIVSSNLRRALATVAIGLKHRLAATGEQILIHSACQEISRNIDCYASATAGAVPHMEGADCGDAAKLMTLPGQTQYSKDIFNPAMNSGQKPLDETGLQRLQDFVEWCFSRPESTIIVAGHSLWFRSFFRVFYDHSKDHPGKDCKMVNGGVVSFTLNRGEHNNKSCYWIEPETIKTIIGGFEEPKKKKMK